MLPTKVFFQVTSRFLLKKRVKAFLFQQELPVTANAFKLIHTTEHIYFFKEKNVCRAIQAYVHEHMTDLN